MKELALGSGCIDDTGMKTKVARSESEHIKILPLPLKKKFNWFEEEREEGKLGRIRKSRQMQRNNKDRVGDLAVPTFPKLN